MARDALCITNVEVFLCGTSWRNLTLVKVSTDAGITGWGDATVEYREYAVAAQTTFIGGMCRGIDALSCPRLAGGRRARLHVR